MKKRFLLTLLPALALALLVGSCGADPSTGSGTTQNWTGSDVLDNATASAIIETAISTAVFDPQTTTAASASAPTLKIYIGGKDASRTIIGVGIDGTDGSALTYSFATEPTIPGWASVSSVTIRAISTLHIGTHGYWVWVINDDNTISNKVFTEFTIRP